MVETSSGRRAAVLGRELSDGVGCFGRGQQVERRSHDLTLALEVVRSAYCSTEYVPGNQHPGRPDEAGLVGEGFYVDADGGDTGLFEYPGCVSDGHMALGSGSDQ